MVGERSCLERLQNNQRDLAYVKERMSIVGCGQSTAKKKNSG
jgi:hypothetical protein